MPVDAKRTYVGIVQDNQDPKKLGRVKIRVVGVFDQMELKDIPWATPWKDLNGNGFNVPEVGKVLTVIFDSGNEYKPEYIYADFYNINLEKKINSLSGSNYTSMKALIFDHKTQIYVNDDEGLKIDYKFNNINIKESQIDISLKDNFTKVNIGDAAADQEAILGTSFLGWFDKFVNALMCKTGATPYIGAPLVPEPNFLRILQEYHLLKKPRFLSKNVFIVDNECVTSVKNETSLDPNLRINEPQVGDDIKTNVIELKTPPQTDEQSFTPAAGTGTENPTKLSPDGTQLPLSENKGDLPKNVPAVENAVVVDPVAKPPDRAERIIEALRRKQDTQSGKSYIIEEKPYVVNLVGVRRALVGQPYPNSFNDEMWAIWKNDQGVWESQKWATTTVPGLKWGSKLIKQEYRSQVLAEYYSNKLKKKVSKGVGILVPAQYDYKLNEGLGKNFGNPSFQGPHLSCNNQACYRDRNWDSPLMTFSEPDDFFPEKIDKGDHGMAIHIAFIPTSDRRDLGYADEASMKLKHFQATTVDLWSLGCNTIPNQNDWIQLLKIVRRSIQEKGQNTVKYSLINESDLAIV
jgi:hypothetical protein